jgi:cobalt-zinc-cadmium efflux system protein
VTPDHAHDDGPAGDAASHARRLALVLALVVAYMGVEIAGGWLSGSLALLADAGHMLSDAGALGLALVAMRLARRPPTAQRTYGSFRAEILAALVNGATLVAVAVFILIEAVNRFRHPPEIEGRLMLAVACGGLLVNGLGLVLLHGGRGASLNMRGAWLHVLTDALGSLQAIAAGALIAAFGWRWVDPLASVLIGLLIVYSSWSLIRQSVDVLMEHAPGHVDVDQIRSALLAIPRVAGVHDLHVWTIASGFVALSAHLMVPVGRDQDAVLQAAQALLADRFGIRHSTIQIDRDPDCDTSDVQS